MKKRLKAILSSSVLSLSLLVPFFSHHAEAEETKNANTDRNNGLKLAAEQNLETPVTEFPAKQEKLRETVEQGGLPGKDRAAESEQITGNKPKNKSISKAVSLESMFEKMSVNGTIGTSPGFMERIPSEHLAAEGYLDTS
ncbi:hypothetical protein [Sediminibacillus massiliensis]|uniref:hypothetical protein n=1 Tax=Sediminibacillus massiliensis TaxID=1926277 RepID=UPI0009888BE4|nr:hypothetical protein [Sediminibacillus massiliensis]